MESPKKNTLRIGVVGTREIEPDAYVHQAVRNAVSDILRQEAATDFIAYSAMAEGADTIFANVVKMDFRQPVKVVLPFDLAEYEKQFSDADVLSEFRRWIKDSGISEVVTDVVPQDQIQREDAYFALGKFICDNSDYVIFVWDGTKPCGKGGTGEILGYCSMTGRTKGILVAIPRNKQDTVIFEINSLLSASDCSAIAAKRNYQYTWISAIVLALLAVICLALGLSFSFTIGANLLIAGLELIFVIAVFALIEIAKATSLHSRLLSERLRAEKLRLLATHYHANVRVAISEMTLETDTELAAIASKVNSAIEDSYKSIWYRYFTIKSLILAQMDYHKNLAKKVISNKEVVLERLKQVVYVAWFCILFSHFFALFLTYFAIHIGFLSDYLYPHEIATLLLISLPALYASIEGFLYFKEWENFKQQSLSMITFLAGELETLEEQGLDEVESEKILNSVSSSMLADNKGWRLILSRRDSPSPIL